jgi:hypothetical protein
MQILQIVNRCRYCGSDMTDSVTSISYLENPYCSSCLNERLKKAATLLGPIKNRVVGRYLEPMLLNQSMT